MSAHDPVFDLVRAHQRLLHDVSVALGEQDVPTVDIAPAVARLRARAEAAEAERDTFRTLFKNALRERRIVKEELERSEARIDKALALIDANRPHDTHGAALILAIRAALTGDDQ